jgi:hypothetical protein
MMVAVAIMGIEFGLITAVATGLGREPTASDWLVSTAVVSELQFLILLLIRII